MSDLYNAQPVRTEGDATDKLQTRILDASNDANALKVNADGSIDANAVITATDLDIRDLDAAQDNVAISDGTDVLAINVDGSINAVVSAADLDIRDLAFATDKVDVGGSVVALDAPTLAALESITVQNGAGAAAVNVQDGGNSITVDATDLDIRDLAFATDKVDVSGSEVSLDATTLAALENITVSATDLDIRDLTSATDSVEVLQASHDNLNANANVQVGNVDVSATNPIPVTIVADVIGTEVNDYNTAAAVAANASSNHNYTPGSAFRLTQILATSSGAAKIEVQVETAAASGVFVTKFVQFSSASTLNMEIKIAAPILVPSGAIVRVIRTNRDNKALDLYSTISGQLL